MSSLSICVVRGVAGLRGDVFLLGETVTRGDSGSCITTSGGEGARTTGVESRKAFWNPAKERRDFRWGEEITR